MILFRFYGFPIILIALISADLGSMEYSFQAHSDPKW